MQAEPFKVRKGKQHLPLRAHGSDDQGEGPNPNVAPFPYSPHPFSGSIFFGGIIEVSLKTGDPT